MQRNSLKYLPITKENVKISTIYLQMVECTTLQAMLYEDATSLHRLMKRIYNKHIFPLRHYTLIIQEFYCKVAGHLYVLLFSGQPDASPYNNLSDNELVEYAKKDIDHFTELFDRYYTRVYQFHYFRLRQTQDAEDLASETFTKIFNKLDTFNNRGIPFSVWVFTVARNTLIDFTRKNKVRIEPIDEIAPEGPLVTNFDMTTVEVSILSDKIWTAIRNLPEKQQQIWALKLSSDLPHNQIAEILDMTENYVNVSVSRSLKTLKKYLSYLAN